MVVHTGVVYTLPLCTTIFLKMNRLVRNM